jgi:hypothetical protein
LVTLQDIRIQDTDSNTKMSVTPALVTGQKPEEEAGLFNREAGQYWGNPFGVATVTFLSGHMESVCRNMKKRMIGSGVGLLEEFQRNCPGNSPVKI